MTKYRRKWEYPDWVKEDLNALETSVYDKAGGGEAGIKALNSMADYYETSDIMIRQLSKQNKSTFYIPKNEKSTITGCTVEDNYDD